MIIIIMITITTIIMMTTTTIIDHHNQKHWHLNLFRIDKISHAQVASALLFCGVRVHPDDPGASGFLRDGSRMRGLRVGIQGLGFRVCVWCTLRPMTTDRPTPPRPNTAAVEPRSTCKRGGDDGDDGDCNGEVDDEGVVVEIGFDIVVEVVVVMVVLVEVVVKMTFIVLCTAP